MLPTLKRIRDFLGSEKSIPKSLESFVKCLIDSINVRVKKLVDNKILRMSTLLDPRYAYDEKVYIRFICFKILFT